MLRTLQKLIGQIYLKRITQLEEKIGYRLSFSNIPDVWINGLVAIDLTRAWKRFGLDATGVDYFTLGAIVNGVSTRFNPLTPQYQSWLGGYLVKFSEEKQWALQDHFNLAVVDQVDWLKDYRDPRPVCELHPSGFREIGLVTVSGYAGKLYAGGGVSHSDVGAGNKSVSLWFDMLFMSSIFRSANRKLKLNPTNFISLKNKGGSYQEIYLKGYIIILEIKKNIKAVLYGNGVIFKRSDGIKIDTFAVLEKQILDTLKTATIDKI